MKEKLQQMQKQVSDLRPRVPFQNRPKFEAEWRSYFEALRNAGTPDAEDAVLAAWAVRADILTGCPRTGLVPAARPRRAHETPEQYLNAIFEEDRHAR